MVEKFLLKVGNRWLNKVLNSLPLVINLRNVRVSTKNQKIKDKSLRHPCTDNDFYNKTSDYHVFDKFDLKTFDCFEMKKDYLLEGTYTDNVNTYLEVVLTINEKYFNMYFIYNFNIFNN